MLTVSKIKACCKELCSHRGGYQHFWGASHLCVRSEVFTAVTVKNSIFWDVTQQMFHRNAAYFGLVLSTQWWRRYIPQKHQFLQEPHGVTPQKTAFFIVISIFMFQKMGATAFSETLVSAYKARWCHNPKDYYLKNPNS
jgi:hypothetical protein